MNKDQKIHDWKTLCAKQRKERKLMEEIKISLWLIGAGIVAFVFATSKWWW